jgi:hypothetical protein
MKIKRSRYTKDMNTVSGLASHVSDVIADALNSDDEGKFFPLLVLS